MIEEYRKLYRTARKQAKELDGVELKTVQSWQRKLLRDYVLILANTGLRVDEAKTLVCVNVGDKADHLAAQIQALERAPSGMSRALSRYLARVMARLPGGPILRRVIRRWLRLSGRGSGQACSCRRSSR